MTTQRLVLSLTAINLVLLAFVLLRMAPAEAEGAPSLLRGSGLEIVDGAGRVRASIGILAPGPSSDGKAAGDTVLLRLINPAGQPSVKIGAGDKTAGLSFVGGDDLSYIIIEADGPESRLTIVEPDGREQTISP